MSQPELRQFVARTLSELGNAPAPEQENGALDTLIGLLLDNLKDQDADSGIAGFAQERLHMLERAARRESEDCLERLRCLLELLDGSVAVGGPPPSRELLQRLCHHLLRALVDHERWQSLADNAGYYRDHREVAARVAQAWQRTTPSQAVAEPR
ncbi:hypothetical protein [Stenotrophomonas sp. MMGLT7]|uniref:hypothetical protein n=1 Tax=Stenotrophomonas sp. MMGLT7 TaxID=2901227 RepID=UPI001E3644A8|nr:hypothetical protein [Stenotrophomonas sp. MMGLT7]MCD7097807.1 hypothetical protein [Stenotrophomonas sp. MMGLT7]